MRCALQPGRDVKEAQLGKLHGARRRAQRCALRIVGAALCAVDIALQRQICEASTKDKYKRICFDFVCSGSLETRVRRQCRGPCTLSASLHLAAPCHALYFPVMSGALRLARRRGAAGLGSGCICAASLPFRPRWRSRPHTRRCPSWRPCARSQRWNPASYTSNGGCGPFALPWRRPLHCCAHAAVAAAAVPCAAQPHGRLLWQLQHLLTL